VLAPCSPKPSSLGQVHVPHLWTWCNVACLREACAASSVGLTKPNRPVWHCLVLPGLGSGSCLSGPVRPCGPYVYVWKCVWCQAHLLRGYCQKAASCLAIYISFIVHMAGLGLLFHKSSLALAPRDLLQSAFYFLCLIYTKRSRASRKGPGRF
jgi:hypothetical protein